MPSARRQRAMFALTVFLFVLIGWMAWDGDRRAFLQADNVTVRQSGEELIFAWRGEVRAPMAMRFEEAFREHRDATDRIVLELSSPGGSLAEGRAVIDVIERMKRTHIVETRVRAFDICLSMCVPLFLQGEKRIAARTARFMFHQPTAVDVFTEQEIEIPDFERRMVADRFYRRYLENSDMAPEWGEKLRAEWEGRDIWKTGKELYEEGSNIVTELG